MVNKPAAHLTFVMLAIVGLALPVRAEPNRSEIVTRDEALTVARNWVTVIMHSKGSWGGAHTAEVTGVREFKRGARRLGYLCPVKPHGFVLISLRRELTPVRAYSAQANPDLEPDSFLTDLLQSGLERIIDRIEEQVGPLASVRTQALESILEINYVRAWAELAEDPATFQARLASDGSVAFRGGDVLLASSWAQGDPYNRFCPIGHDDSRTMVGCVATAAAQIMNYWAWPPSGVGSHSYTWDGDEFCSSDVCGGRLGATFSDPYDWAHMARHYLSDGAGGWQDETGAPLLRDHLDAVAELTYEAGLAAGMDYGVYASGVPTSRMQRAYEDHFRYSKDIIQLDRADYGGVDWFNHMKDQFSANRPVHYRVSGHSLVADGWQEVGSTPSRQYHMNVGWGSDAACGGNPCQLWYTLDALTARDQAPEAMLINVLPAPALGARLSGTYVAPSFPYRYVDQDATGHDAVFGAGHSLQFLPGVKVTCTSPTGGRITFSASGTGDTYLFARGNPSTGIRMHSGHIHLLYGGTLKFH